MSRASRTCDGGYRTSPKIQAAIGWNPTIPLAQVLKDVIEHFREVVQIAPGGGFVMSVRDYVI